jgi:hypothetical protein
VLSKATASVAGAMEGADPRGRLSRLGEGAIRFSNVFVPLLVLTFFP